jgi:hypothetical protein
MSTEPLPKALQHLDPNLDELCPNKDDLSFVPTQKRWLVIDDFVPGTVVVSYIIRELYAAIQQSGDYTALLNAGEFNPKFFSVMLKEHPWNYILWPSIAALKFYDQLVDHPAKKICLWYDEPVTRIKTWNMGHCMKPKDGITHLIWDRYWMDIAKQMWGIKAIHGALSAGPEFFPADTRLSDDIVFVGCLQSPQAIAKEIEQTTPVMRKALRHIMGRMDYPRDAVQMTADAVDMMTPGDGRLFNLQMQTQLEATGHYYQAVWMLGKNAKRIPALKRAMRVAPLRIFTEAKYLKHASGVEICAMLGEWGNRLNVYEINSQDTNCYAECYHYGGSHIGATDPQSVVGGVPLRTFQTAASGRALISDFNLETSQGFESGKEMLYYSNLDQLEAQVADLLAHPDKEREIGLAARKRFEKEHTWQHRLEQIKGAI